MHINVVTCPECRPVEHEEASVDEAKVLIQESPRLRITTEIAQVVECPKKHTFLLLSQDGGYALLYERALQRLADGRTRDAVLDAYTALDMFLGLFVLGTAFERRHPASTPLDGVRLSPLRDDLKEVLRASERTIGAALTLASIASGATPPRMPGKLNELRNKAIHAGAYPSDEEAEWACLQVEELVCAFRAQLTLTPVEGAPPNTLTRFQALLISEARERALSGGAVPTKTSSYSLYTVLALDAPPGKEKASDRLAEYRRGDRPVFID